MARKILTLSLAVVIVFGVVVAILMQLVPGPRKPADYLVIGAVGTLVSLLAVFLVLITGMMRSPDVFYKRRQKIPPEQTTPPDA